MQQAGPSQLSPGKNISSLTNLLRIMQKLSRVHMLCAQLIVQRPQGFHVDFDDSFGLLSQCWLDDHGELVSDFA
jgi:hypothetical protein